MKTKQPKPPSDPKLKTCLKLVPFDSVTWTGIVGAADALDLPKTVFIRLAVTRAFEQLAEIYLERVDAAAQDFLDRRTRGFFRTKGHLCKPRFEPDDGAYLDELVKRALSLRVSRSDALDAITQAFARPVPRTRSPLRIRGSLVEQRMVARLLQGPGKKRERATREMRAAMAEVFMMQVTFHGRQWSRLPALQQRAKEKIMMGATGMLESHKKHIAALREGLKCLNAGTDPAPSFQDELGESSMAIQAAWSRATTADRIKLIEGRIDRLVAKLPLLKKFEQRAALELRNLMCSPEIWLNPWALGKWLEDNVGIDQFLR